MPARLVKLTVSVAALAVLSTAIISCGARPAGNADRATSTIAGTAPTYPTTPVTAATVVATTVPVSPLASAIRDLPPATGLPTPETGPQPVRLSIGSLKVESAPIIPVTVTDDTGELDVPDPKVVGWYQYSPRPGAPGASVLASHVNFDGVPGVFRYLNDVEPGAEVVVEFDDGSEKRFEITEVSMYDKDELPAERVWAREGDPTLVLFTCGGRFNESLRSFEDNVVAYARPIL